MRPLARLTGAKGLVVNRVTNVEQDESGAFWYGSGSTTSSGNTEGGDGFLDYVTRIYKSNGPVFACIGARMLPFSEARFQYQEIHDGRPGRLFNGPALNLLSTPWPNGTTGDLLSRMEQDASLAGNFYATKVGTPPRIRRLRPDFVKIVSGVRNEPDTSAWDMRAEVLGYIYDPRADGVNATFLSVDAVAHYAPIPDPEAQWMGMSWLTPVLNEIQADGAANRHKTKFFENGAALATVISYDAAIAPEAFERYVKLFEAAHRGSNNAYKTLHIGGGADVTAIGTELKTDFRAIQGAGETRIAAAAGVGAIIARLSEGMQGSALNEGNYNSAKRQFADMTLRPLWRSAAGALAKFVDVPENARLWTDSRDVDFLKDDRSDRATILATTASTMRQLVDAGYTPESVVDAVEADDLTRLVHSGLYSVQLQEAGGQTMPKAEVAELLKVGARNSGSDQALIQTAHDAITAAGATCPTP